MTNIIATHTATSWYIILREYF